MRFGTVPQSPILFLKPRYVTIKSQDKPRPKAFPCFFIGPSANRPRNIYEVLLSSGSVFTLATSHGRGYLLQSLFLKRTRVLYLFQRREGSWTRVAMEWWKRMRMRMWIVMSQACPPAFDRASLQAWLLRLMRLSHAGELHQRAVEVPPRLLC